MNEKMMTVITVLGVILGFGYMFYFMTDSMPKAEIATEMQGCQDIGLKPKILYNGWNGMPRDVTCIQLQGE